MKKLSLFNLVKKNLFGLLVLSALLSGCKTLPDPSLTVVDPLDLLDNNSTFYLAVPKDADPELISTIIKSNMKGVSESDVNQICQRINKVYVGLNKQRYTTEVQAAIDSNIPVKFLPTVLSKKNGWVVKGFKPEEAKTSYDIYSQPEISMTFPSEKIACLGRNLEDMLSSYDSIHNIPAEESMGQSYNQIDPAIYNWLKGAENDIRFYANKPQSYLSMLTGANLDLKLSDVKGRFRVDPKYPNQYLLDLDFNFKAASYLRLGKNLLSLAFGLTNSDYETPNANELLITNIHISKNQLYKLLIQ